MEISGILKTQCTFYVADGVRRLAVAVHDAKMRGVKITTRDAGISVGMYGREMRSAAYRLVKLGIAEENASGEISLLVGIEQIQPKSKPAHKKTIIGCGHFLRPIPFDEMIVTTRDA